MKNPFSGLFRARDKPQDSVSAAPAFYFGTSGSGKAVNAQTAIQLSTVYACVRVISETVASLPLGVYEAKEDGNRKATEHPLYRLVHDEPNSEMTSFVLREVIPRNHTDERSHERRVPGTEARCECHIMDGYGHEGGRQAELALPLSSSKCFCKENFANPIDKCTWQ